MTASLRENKYSAVLPVEETRARARVRRGRVAKLEQENPNGENRKSDREELQARGVIGKDWRGTRSKCQRESLSEQETSYVSAEETFTFLSSGAYSA